jgi:excisionase family DNA binding protein
MCETQPQLKNAAEMATLLAVKEATFRDLARRRGWPCYRIGRQVRFDPEEIRRFLREND